MFCLSIAALALTGCGKNSQGKQTATSSLSSSAAISETKSAASTSTSNIKFLNPDKLTPAENASLVMYYRNAHMPENTERDYSADMGISGQQATVTIYDKNNVPKGDGPLYKNYPDGA